MRRILVAGLVAGTVLTLSMAVLAAPTEEQKQKIVNAQTQVETAQKEWLNTQAKVGLITQDQAQKMIGQIEAKAAQRTPLTSEQQKELAVAFAGQVAAYKAIVNAQVEAGVITRVQGDLLLKQIDAAAAYQEKVGFLRPGGRYERNDSRSTTGAAKVKVKQGTKHGLQRIQENTRGNASICPMMVGQGMMGGQGIMGGQRR